MKIKKDTKKAKLVKINGIRPTTINQEPKPIDEHGYPIPKQVECSNCQANFWLKFSISRQNYVLKNNLDYWTEQVTDQGKYICNTCLRSLYYNKPVYWCTIKNLRKRANLAGYVNNNFV